MYAVPYNVFLLFFLNHIYYLILTLSKLCLSVSGTVGILGNGEVNLCSFPSGYLVVVFYSRIESNNAKQLQITADLYNINKSVA